LKLNSPQELEGRTVAVKKGTSTYGGFLQFLEANDLNPASMRIIDMRPADMPEALVAGSIDALVASEPTPSLAEARGGLPLATLGGMGNTYPILIVARKNMLQERPELAVGFLRALIKAAVFMRSEPDKATELLAKATGLKPDLVRDAMARHTYELRLDERIRKSLEQTASFLKAQGRIRTLPDLNRAIDGRYLKKALQDR
jgi:ABC-type nitrate/sulfonate/bicarbonate transport system substrate-binding protein